MNKYVKMFGGGGIYHLLRDRKKFLTQIDENECKKLYNDYENLTNNKRY